MSGAWWVDENDLLQEQLQVLSEDLSKDMLLSGPPGSGKTNLLLLRANHLMLASPEAEFYIICFTALLQNFVRTGAEMYLFPANRIITQRKLWEQVLGDHGRLPKRQPGQSYEEREVELRCAMHEMMKARIGRHSFPVLFIDEAQDYSDTDLDVFRYLAKNISCAADLRQGIYSAGANGATWLEGHVWDAPITLRFHYRVAPAILEVADKIMDGKFGHTSMLATHQYKGDPGTVDRVAGLDLAEQIESAVPRIAKQLAVYPGEVIGVLVPRREDLEQIVEGLSAAPELAEQITNAMSREFDPTLPIWVSTLHSSKGLEFRCVHFMAADTVAKFREHERRLVFTGVTRAKTALTIYHDQPLHAFFASALAKPNTEKITVKKLFGKAS